VEKDVRTLQEYRDTAVKWPQKSIRIDFSWCPQASEVIDFLKSLPRKASGNGSTADRPQVKYEEQETDKGAKRTGVLLLPDGRKVYAGSYGIETPGEDFTNDTTFFQLWIGDRGGWNIRITDILARAQGARFCRGSPSEASVPEPRG